MLGTFEAFSINKFNEVGIPIPSVKTCSKKEKETNIISKYMNNYLSRQFEKQGSCHRDVRKI